MADGTLLSSTTPREATVFIKASIVELDMNSQRYCGHKTIGERRQTVGRIEFIGRFVPGLFYCTQQATDAGIQPRLEYNRGWNITGMSLGMRGFGWKGKRGWTAIEERMLLKT